MRHHRRTRNSPSQQPIDPQRGLLFNLNLPTVLLVGAVLLAVGGSIFATENRITKLEANVSQTMQLPEKLQQIVVTLEVVKVKLSNLERKLGVQDGEPNPSTPKH